MLKKLSKDNYKISTIFICLITMVGIALRLRQFIFNRTMWVDECSLAHIIINKNLNELFSDTLHTKMIAPFGFLIIEKCANMLINSLEYSLRIFPLICGLLSFFFFFKIVNRLQEKKGVIISLILFSISPPLIYYSSEAKQYSCDLLICLMLIHFSLQFYTESTHVKRNALLFGVIAGLSIWFSFISVIVLTGITLSIFALLLIKKQKQHIKYLLYIATFWISNFITLIGINLFTHITNKGLHNYWDWAYISMNDHEKNHLILNHLLWFLRMDSFYIAPICFFCGVAAFFFRKKLGLIIISPILITAILSILKQYPFAERTIVFLIPLFFIFISQGIVETINTKEIHLTFWGVIIAIMLITKPASASINIWETPTKRFDIASIMKYIKEHAKKDDIIYLQYFSQSQFKLYGEKYKFNTDFPLLDTTQLQYNLDLHFYKNRWYKKEGLNPIFLGRISSFSTTKSSFLEHEFMKLHGKGRVWLVFSHISDREAPTIISYVSTKAKKIDSYYSTGSGLFISESPYRSEDAFTYLYQF